MRVIFQGMSGVYVSDTQGEILYIIPNIRLMDNDIKATDWRLW